MAVGDLMLARSVGDRLLAKGPGAVFSGVTATLGQADLRVANLECVISDQGVPQPKSYTFRAPPVAAQALAQAGFNVVGLANNHSLDYGTAALADMLSRLRVNGIAYVGAGADAEAARAPVILDRNGLHVAFLSYVNVPVEGRTAFDTRSWAAGVETPGVAWADPAAITQDVSQARTLADVVVVLLHDGLEGHAEYSTLQQSLAHTAIDAGAALVLGSHSHVLQPVERYKGGLIAYSLGNFVFDGFLDPANDTAIFSATLTPLGVTSYEWLPVVIDHGLPRLATPAEAALILSRVQ
jgi:poly-gamma-glutamate synthesis protein (capsule biosynthesis protein)